MHVFMILGALCFSASAQEPGAPVGPVAYYMLDEATGATTVTDSAGTNNGTYVGGQTISPTIPVPPITYPDLASLSVNGTSQAVSVPSFGTFTNFSVAVWINRSTTVTTARQTIVSYKENSNNGFVLCLNEDGSSGFPRIWVNATPGGWLFNESPAVLPAGWNHLAASYDGGNIRLYINGIEHLPATAAPGVMTNSASDTMAIGARNSVNLHWFPGLIDDVRVYGRALTATEVQVLAAGTPAPMTLTATAGLNQVMLGWSAPAGPAATYSYTVKRRDSGFGNYVALNTVSVLSYTDTTAVGGTPYDYVVTAISAAESGPSSSVTVTPTSPAPPTPLGGKGDASCGSGVADAPGPFFMMLLIPALGLLMLPSSWLALVRRRRG